MFDGSGESGTAAAQRGVEALRAAVDALAGVDAAGVDAGVLGGLVRELKTLGDRLVGVRGGWLAAFDAADAGRGEGFASSERWVAGDGRTGPREAKRDVEAARALARRPVTRAALAGGRVSAGHARVIRRVLADAAWDEEEAAKLEAELVEAAGRMDPEQLARYGRRLVLEREPADEGSQRADGQHRRRRLSVRVRPDGMVIIDGLLSPDGGEYVLTALNALGQPEAGDVPAEERRTSEQRRADALVELARRALDAGGLPETGGQRPHVTVTIDLPTLLERDGAAGMDWTGPVPAETARRLACDAKVSRVITGPDSQPLDVGRASRTVKPWQRRALAVRDRGCRRCGAPAVWCEGHHIIYWEDGGDTDLDNLMLLCRGCHQQVHEGGWAVKLLPDTTAVFTHPDGTTIRTKPPP